jgi:hypothetical protein
MMESVPKSIFIHAPIFQNRYEKSHVFSKSRLQSRFFQNRIANWRFSKLHCEIAINKSTLCQIALQNGVFGVALQNRTAKKQLQKRTQSRIAKSHGKVALQNRTAKSHCKIA